MPIQKEKWNKNQLKAIDLFAGGATTKEVADAIGMSQASTKRWHCMPDFKEEILLVRERMRDGACGVANKNARNVVNELLNRIFGYRDKDPLVKERYPMPTNKEFVLLSKELREWAGKYLGGLPLEAIDEEMEETITTFSTLLSQMRQQRTEKYNNAQKERITKRDANNKARVKRVIKKSGEK